MRRISGARTKALRTGLSFVLTFAMTVGSLPMDGIAYASITKGAQAPQTETKVEVSADNAAAMSAGVAADTTNISTDVTADKPKTVKVRFDANGGEGHMDDFEVTLNNSDWSVAEMPFIRDGYRFVGWSIAAEVAKDVVDDPETDIDESLTGLVLADKQGFVDLVSQKRDEDGNVVETHDFGKYVSDDVLTLYAQWEKVETTEVSVPVVEENEVAKTEENVDEAIVADETSEDMSVDVATDSDDMTLDEEKELDREFLSGAFGGKTDGGVADKIGTSNPLSRKLMAPLMAAAAPSLTTQSTPEGSREGTAYAVLDSAGTLTFFRSTNSYTAGTGKTVTDVMGKTYTGRVYKGVENTGAISSTASPWYSQRSKIKLARIADGQVIAPVTCENWFDSCKYMTAFKGAERLDTSAVTSMVDMFNGCSSMTESPVTSNWNTSAVSDMSQMFRDCSKMTTPPAVDNWNTSKLIDMHYMFYKCSAMTEPPALGNWNTSKVTRVDYMFSGCSSMTEPPAVGSWNTSKVTTMSSMFSGCSSMTEPPAVGNWNTGAVIIMSSMFYNCSSMTEPPAVGSWNTGEVTYMVGMFNGCKVMTEPPAVGSWNTSKVTYMNSMFNGCNAMVTPPAVGSWNTSAVTDMSSMFNGCSSMTEPPSVGNWNISKVTSMVSMFNNCLAMMEPPAVSSWDTGAVTDMSYMFGSCSAIMEPPAVGSWNTSAVTNMGYMFQNCSAMTEPPSVSNWNTSAVTSMSSMFYNCSAMPLLDVSGWNFSKLTSEGRYLGLHRCSALRELKVPADARITGLPEHASQGDYAETWGNVDRGITGSTAANLMSTVNAGNGAGTWTWDKAAAEYTVNFMVDGSPAAMQAEQVKADEDYTVPSCEVTKLYHDFVEWSGSDGKTYHAGDVVTAGTFAAGETLTLTAVFAPHEYGPGEIEGNLQLTVPASINFVVEPDGTLMGPSNASIVNESAVGTRVSSVEVKELDGFNFVANAENSGEQNAVELRFGPLSDMLDAASLLSKSGVADVAWAMGTTSGQNTVQLETEGKVAHVGADITKTNKFGEIRWYVKAGE